jgi:enoyl-CoA hydratase
MTTAQTSAYTCETCRVEVRDGAVAVVTLSRPKRGNAMGSAFWRDLPLVFDALSCDDAVRAVVLHGEGKHFSTGLDLQEVLADLGPLLMGDNNLAKQRTALLAEIMRLQAAFNAIERCRKPVVAAIHGRCVGGAVEMACACDVRVCSADATFSLKEVRLAIVADLGGLQRLPFIVGQGHARELALTGRDIDAARALHIHLVNDVLPSPEDALAAALSLAADIAQNPPLTVQGVKHHLNQGRGQPVERGLADVALWNAAFLQSADLAEAFMAFASGRAPTFKGE